MDFKQILKPSNVGGTNISNTLAVGAQRMKEKEEKFQRLILKDRNPNIFLSGQWSYAQVQGVNRVKALEAKKDIFFTPNRLKGNYRSDKEVEAFNAFFIDLDSGKEETGNYLPINIVKRRKNEMRNLIAKLPRYTALIETRNGYHVYWAIKEGIRINLEEWKRIQSYIVNKAGADPKVIDAARLLRMPNTFWVKAYKGHYDPFFTSIVEVSEVEYDPQELKILFGGQVTPTNITSPTEKRDTTVRTVGLPIDVAGYSNNIDAIRELDHRYFNGLFNSQEHCMTRKEAVAGLRSNVSLNAFLGVPKNFCCIFHNDKNPSAVIIPPSGRQKIWNYFCHSTKCSFNGSMDIIDVTMVIANVDFNRAVKFLAACFSISISGKRGRHINDMIRGNITAIQTIMCERDAYKKKLQPILDTYTALLELAKTTANLTNTQYYGTDVYFSASKRYLAKQIGTNDEASTYRKTVLLAALGLMEKVADVDLPDSIKQRDYIYRRDLETHFGSGHTIQYYRVKAIDSLKEMQVVKKQLDKWISGKGQIDKINEKLISRIFGFDAAAGIYAKKEHPNTASITLPSNQGSNLIA